MAAMSAIARSSKLHRSLQLLRLSLLLPRPFSSSPSPLLHRPHSLSSSPTLRALDFNTSGLYHNYLCTSAKSASSPATDTTADASVTTTDAAGTTSDPSGTTADAAGTTADAAVTSDQTEPVPEVKSTSSGDSEGGGEEGSKQSGDAGRAVRGSPVSWMSFFLLLVTGAGIIFYYDREKKRHIEELSIASNSARQGPSVGQAAIGGPFKLINHEGKQVTEADFLGQWTVLYFGFTHCPDICPDELLKLAAAVDKIKEKSGIEIVPVFISVDPERDTVEQISEYVKEFHPKLIGLTGDPDEIRKVARAYRVYYMKTAEEGSDYLVDHSIVMYLMSPKMEFVKFYGKNNDVDALANGIIKDIKQYKK